MTAFYHRRQTIWIGAAVVFAVFGTATHAVTPEDTVAEWRFESERVSGRTISEPFGGHDATLEGPMALIADRTPQALYLQGDENTVKVDSAALLEKLPRAAITVEAWLSIDRTVEWGGIAGILKDNKGWQLGARQSSFAFGVSTAAGKDKPSRTIHVRARPSLLWGHWYHVVGTYDGAMMKLYVNGNLERASNVPQGDIVYPKEGEFEIGKAGRFRSRGPLHKLSIYRRALEEKEVQALYEEEKAAMPAPLAVKVGPYLQRINKSTVEVFWETEEPCASTVAYGQSFPLNRRAEVAPAVTRHKVTVTDIEDKKMYYYRIVQPGAGEERLSRVYEYDATFDYSPLLPPIKNVPFPEDRSGGNLARDFATKILYETGIHQGYCLVLGGVDGRLTLELARRTELDLVVVDDDEARVAALRQTLDKTGLYGTRISVHHGSLSTLPYSDYLANLVVSERTLMEGTPPVSIDEIYRVLRPCGGTAYLGQPKEGVPEEKRLKRDDLESLLAEAAVPETELRLHEGALATIVRGPLEGAGEWSHMYGNAEKTANSYDEHPSGQMGLLWFGRPGPRPMVDRGTRPPAPLSTNGRLIVQGDRKLFGMDAYNGTILWVWEIPDLRRANLPRDTGNMAAGQNNLYVAMRDSCWTLDAQTGERLAAYHVKPGEDGTGRDWGYVALVGEKLLGSTVRQGGIFIGADGEWYDRPDEESDKVVSDSIFAVDRTSGEERWTYKKGLIINSTIVHGDGHLHFVESRNDEAAGLGVGRIGPELIASLYLVALDVQTGAVVWEKPIEVNEARYVLHLSYAEGTLVAVSTSNQFHVYAFDAKDGKELWAQHHAMGRNHHGGAIQHPVINGGIVYAEPQAYLLETGEKLDIKMPDRRGCGAMSASANAMFFRHHFHGMWDLQKDEKTQFLGLRSGCWMGLISAGGVVLAPESSAGCHCTHPIQASIALVDRSGRITFDR